MTVTIDTKRLHELAESGFAAVGSSTAELCTLSIALLDAYEAMEQKNAHLLDAAMMLEGQLTTLRTKYKAMERSLDERLADEFARGFAQCEIEQAIPLSVELTTLRAERAELMEMLHPFAAVADCWRSSGEPDIDDNDIRDEYISMYGYKDISPSLFRAARALLARLRK